MEDKRKNIAIITGASSGIGESFVKYVAEDKGLFGGSPLEEIWIVARRESRLLELKEKLSDDRIRVVPCDLSSSVDKIEDLLKQEDPRIGLLINCAGLGKKGPVADRPAGDLEDTLDLNCTGLSVLTRICLPYMISRTSPFSRKDGPRIINIASSAAFLPQPGFASYAASKSFVVSFSRALDMELRPQGIAVTTVCPGPVRTEFEQLATDGKSKDFTGFRKYVSADPGKLAKASLRASKAGRHMFVYGISQKALHLVSKIVPSYWIIRMEGAALNKAGNEGETAK
ncbi:MAG: SDR family NAD(P)-dependent oxidoreductase [Clostridiales bacterium]|nr:SDR family NAD(P)-dependent oxidoreductase [Clostridiales bacterium]